MKVWNYYCKEIDPNQGIQMYVCDIRDLYKQKQIVKQDESKGFTNYIVCPADDNYVIHSDDFVRIDIESSSSPIIMYLKKVLMESVFKSYRISWMHQFKYDVFIVILESRESEEVEYKRIN